MSKDGTDQAIENLKNIQAGIQSIVEDRDRLLDSLTEALEIIDKLKEALPKVLCSTGADLCKIAESILPGETAVVIKMNPSTHMCTLHILGEKEEVTLADLEYYLANAHRVGQHMEDEGGVLVARHEKAIN